MSEVWELFLVLQATFDDIILQHLDFDYTKVKKLFLKFYIIFHRSRLDLDLDAKIDNQLGLIRI